MKSIGMVDIGKKAKTKRIAKAQAFIKLNKEIIKKIRGNDIPKGNVLEIARAAGIYAAKNTAGLIPLCHNIELEYADVEYILKNNGILLRSTVRATSKTGVEMEAMAACSIAALTIYDMCKMFSKSIEVKDIYLIEKKGGKSGTYKRSVQ
jgi:cyclic pyranopterin phosphate synthase